MSNCEPDYSHLKSQYRPTGDDLLTRPGPLGFGFFIFRDAQGNSWRTVQKPMSWKERSKTLLKVVTPITDTDDPKKRVMFGNVVVD